MTIATVPVTTASAGRIVWHSAQHLWMRPALLHVRQLVAVQLVWAQLRTLALAADGSRSLGDDYFGVGSNIDWVEAVICISGVLNGSTFAYKFGCDPVTGVLTDDPERLIQATVDIGST